MKWELQEAAIKRFRLFERKSSYNCYLMLFWPFML